MFPVRWIFALFIASLFLTGCASYRLGSTERSLPGGYDLVAIPVFKNKTMESGAEVPFTNALIEEFEKSRVARVMPKDQAQVTILGSVDSVSCSPTSYVTGDPYLPQHSALVSSYRIVVTASLKVVRNADQQVLWQGSFQNEKSYLAPVVTVATVNSVDALYNQSARDKYIAQMAQDMMSEAHNRITESF